MKTQPHAHARTHSLATPRNIHSQHSRSFTHFLPSTICSYRGEKKKSISPQQIFSARVPVVCAHSVLFFFFFCALSRDFFKCRQERCASHEWCWNKNSPRSLCATYNAMLVHSLHCLLWSLHVIKTAALAINWCCAMDKHLRHAMQEKKKNYGKKLRSPTVFPYSLEEIASPEKQWNKAPELLPREIPVCNCLQSPLCQDVYSNTAVSIDSQIKPKALVSLLTDAYGQSCHSAIELAE